MNVTIRLFARLRERFGHDRAPTLELGDGETIAVFPPVAGG